MKIDATKQRKLSNILDFREQLLHSLGLKHCSPLLTSGCFDNGWIGREANQSQRIVIFINDNLPWSYIIVSPKGSICLLA